MNNPKGDVQVPLSTFGGLSTELNPPDIPEGGSPYNSDVAFVPGSVATRPALSRLPSPPDTTARLYHQSLKKQDGSTVNLYLHASGHLWVEDVTNNPGVFTNVMDVTPGSRCKSVQAGGRLYMAFNDGFHGTDIPRWFDGEKWGRVSQGGPCLNPMFNETIGAAVGLATTGDAVSLTIVSAVTDNPSTSSTQIWHEGYWIPQPPNGVWVEGYWETVGADIYSTITVTLSDVTGLSIGQKVSISGNTSSGLNSSGYHTVVAISGMDVSLSYNLPQYLTGTGGALSGYGPSLSRTNGIVTAGTSAPHRMIQGDMLTISDVAATEVGGGIVSAVRADNVATITTSSSHGARTGNVLTIAGVTDTSFNGTWTVTAVLSSVAFQVTSANLADATSSGGTVSASWNNTRRFVISTPDANTLTYADEGPDCVTSSTDGIITPMGQIAGGPRGAVCLFQTDSEFITPPSIPIRLEASGGKKLVANNIPIGPSNTVARIIAFTGVNGGKYFYIPVPARSNGNVISTSTVINDNTSTTAIFDFSDETLLSASGIDIDGNNLFRARVLGNCSSVDWYGDQMYWLGDENRAIRFQNMGFEGGQKADGSPAAWTLTGSASVVTDVDFGCGIQFAYTGTPALVAELYDTATSSVLASATITPTSQRGFSSAVFSAKTPAVIPSTLQLRIRSGSNILSQPAWLDYYGNQILETSTQYTFKAWTHINGAGTFVVDELGVIYSERPWNERQFWVSYPANYETVDGLTGVVGSASDSSPIMDHAVMRSVNSALKDSFDFYFVTRNDYPRGGGLHRVTQVADKNPSEWSVAGIARNVGADTMHSMANGETWLAWANGNGSIMFDGSMPKKITQDIQELWQETTRSQFATVSAVNDAENRRIIWARPTDAGNNLIVLDYRYGEDAGDIQDRASVKVSPYTGKMLVTDLSRKFTSWNIPATYVSCLQTADKMETVVGDAQGRSYRLDPTKYQDDDYGRISASYVTSFFVGDDQEQALRLGSFQHFFSFMTIGISGVGNLRITPLVDSMSNAWPVRGPYPLSLDPNYEIRIPLNISGRRVAFKVEAIPLDGTLDSYFNLSRMVVTMRPHPKSLIVGR